MNASYPNKVITWTDKKNGKNGDDVEAEDINGAYAEIIAIENELKAAKEVEDFIELTAESNIFTCNLSLKSDFSINNQNSTAKSIVFSNVSNGLNAVGIKITFTSLATITYPTATWINTLTPVVGKTYYILFVSTNASTWSVSFFEG